MKKWFFGTDDVPLKDTLLLYGFITICGISTVIALVCTLYIRSVVG